jgi:LPXTG-motif cell wall-anchored protein
MARSTRLAVATAVLAGAVGAGSTATAGAQGAPVCVSETYEWVGSERMVFPDVVGFSTGVVIPPPGPGETLEVTSAAYDSFDEYELTAVPTRAEADQANELWQLVIGGEPFGSPTADVPDTVAEGARDDFYGEISGTLGTGPIAGGEITGIHASQFDPPLVESANSVSARGLTIVVLRCTPPPPTTGPAPPTTDPAPPTTGPAPPTTDPPFGITTLPRTGGSSQQPLLATGSLLLAFGAGLVVVSRLRHRRLSTSR